MTISLFTIGGYGHSKESFFRALEANQIDVFVDIRQRRGMRGSQYAFLNSTALQTELSIRNIAYIYLKELAPTSLIREAQKQSDAVLGTSKRNREILGDTFICAYKESILEKMDPADILAKLSAYTKPCLFCVEGSEKACHRYLVTDWISLNSLSTVTHINRS